ncbi:MAG TPA: hypothetical protein V6D28_02060 [Leptolyngbyaceae cyanobacterium]
MNLLANAIEALEESNQGKSYRQIQNNPNQIAITTEIAIVRHFITIKIADSGHDRRIARADF